MDETAGPTNAADGELVARRRELEAEFDAKVRDLKAQSKRQTDKLAQDRLDWEQSRKAQLKDVADRTERLRRAEDNHKRDAEALRATRRDLEATRERAQEAGEAKVEAKQARASQADLTSRLDSTRNLAAWLSIVAVVGFLAALAAALSQGDSITAGLGGLLLLLALFLEWRRRSIR